MANYSTNLKTWGGTGEAFPDGYSYVEGEQPVDAWDNFVNYNLIADVSDHLIPLTNSRIETDKGASGNEPTSPETSHLYSDEGNEVLRRWNDTASVWRNIATEYWVNNNADVPNADYADDAGLYKGNDIDSDGDGKVDAADSADNATNADQYDNTAPSDGTSGQVMKTDGTAASWGNISLSVQATDYTDVSGSRSGGTWYQNTTGNPLLVYVVSIPDNYYNVVDIHVNTSQTNRVVFHNEVGHNSARSNSDVSLGTVFVVPDGYYYKATSDNYGANGFTSWHEQELQTN